MTRTEKIEQLRRKRSDGDLAIGVAFSGSGFKLGYHAGAAVALMEKGVRFSVIGGVSGGAIVGAQMAQGGQAMDELLAELYLIEGPEDFYTGHPIMRVVGGKESVYGFRPLEEKVRRFVQKDRFTTPFIAGVTAFEKSRAGQYYIVTSDDDEDVLQHGIVDSARVIPWVPPGYDGDQVSADGGFVHQLGDLIRFGVDALVIVSAQPLDHRAVSLHSPSGLTEQFPVISRALDAVSVLTSATLYASLREFRAINDLVPPRCLMVGHSGTVYQHIQEATVEYRGPHQSGMDIWPEKMQALIHAGYEDTLLTIEKTDWLQ